MQRPRSETQLKCDLSGPLPSSHAQPHLSSNRPRPFVVSKQSLPPLRRPSATAEPNYLVGLFSGSNLASAAFPIGMFVGIIFWTLYHIDRKLIFPVELDEFFPAILNHCMHTTVIPYQLGQMLLVKQVFPAR